MYSDTNIFSDISGFLRIKKQGKEMAKNLIFLFKVNYIMIFNKYLYLYLRKHFSVITRVSMGN